jgi:hypothetical protein
MMAAFAPTVTPSADADEKDQKYLLTWKGFSPNFFDELGHLCRAKLLTDAEIVCFPPGPCGGFLKQQLFKVGMLFVLLFTYRTYKC